MADVADFLFVDSAFANWDVAVAADLFAFVVDWVSAIAFADFVEQLKATT